MRWSINKTKNFLLKELRITRPLSFPIKLYQVVRTIIVLYRNIYMSYNETIF